MYPRLPPGFSVRAPTEEDIPAILGLLHDVDIAETGEVEPWTPASVQGWWADLDVTADAWLVFAADGRLVGYASVTDEGGGRLMADGYVHPAQRGQGIGGAIIEIMEQRADAIVAAQPPGTRLVLVNNIMANSDAARNLLEVRSYALTRVFFQMQIALNAAPPAPQWPQGIRVRACEDTPEDVRRAYETIEEGFKDHWGHAPRSFEDWHSHTFNEPVELALWFLVQEGDQVAGAALCRVRDDGSGWIRQLAVLRPWRKRGVGLALLYHTFTTFYERGIQQVGLGVDGQSLTGAQRLYERAGMHVAARYARYEKELRPGKDLLGEQ